MWPPYNALVVPYAKGWNFRSVETCPCSELRLEMWNWCSFSTIANCNTVFRSELHLVEPCESVKLSDFEGKLKFSLFISNAHIHVFPCTQTDHNTTEWSR